MQKQNQPGIPTQFAVSVVCLVFIHFFLWFIYFKRFITGLALDYQPPVILYWGYDLDCHGGQPWPWLWAYCSPSIRPFVCLIEKGVQLSVHRICLCVCICNASDGLREYFCGHSRLAFRPLSVYLMVNESSDMEKLSPTRKKAAFQLLLLFFLQRVNKKKAFLIQSVYRWVQICPN